MCGSSEHKPSLSLSSLRPGQFSVSKKQMFLVSHRPTPLVNSDDSPDSAGGAASVSIPVSACPDLVVPPFFPFSAVESSCQTFLTCAIDTTETHARRRERYPQRSPNTAIHVVMNKPINPSIWVVLTASIVPVRASLATKRHQDTEASPGNGTALAQQCSQYIQSSDGRRSATGAYGTWS